MQTDYQTEIEPQVRCDDLLGVTSSINGLRLTPATIGVPSLCNGCPELCEGCGAPKLHRGKEASILVCCNACYRKLPAWLKDARAGENSIMWENRMAVVLMWMREANTPNDKIQP